MSLVYIIIIHYEVWQKIPFLNLIKYFVLLNHMRFYNASSLYSTSIFEIDILLDNVVGKRYNGYTGVCIVDAFDHIFYFPFMLVFMKFYDHILDHNATRKPWKQRS